MKRLLIVFTLALATLLPAAASAQLLTLQLSPEHLDFIAAAPAADDLAVGEAKFALETSQGTISEQLTLSAHGTPADARGHFRYRASTFSDREGDVDCLFVAGNRAVATGALDEPISPSLTHFAVVVEDNGEPSAVNPTPDRYHAGFSSFLLDCRAVTEPTTRVVQQGNLVVKDRP